MIRYRQDKGDIKWKTETIKKGQIITGRKKLADAGSGSFIETIWGLGYKWVK